MCDILHSRGWKLQRDSFHNTKPFFPKSIEGNKSKKIYAKRTPGCGRLFFLLLRPNSCPTSSWVRHTGWRQHDWLAAGSCNQLTRCQPEQVPKRPTSQHLNIPPSTKKFLSCLLIEVSDASSWHGAQCNTASC